MDNKISTITDKVTAIGRLVRLPNVLMIILIQLLVRYSIISPYVYGSQSLLISPLPDYIVLMLITLLLAVGGYVINDYFDVKIDSINRPEKMVVNRLISPGRAIFIHMILNGIAVLLGFYLAFRIKAFSFGFLFPFISGLLWVYSAKYKRVLFWGNFIVSILSSFVILVLWLFEFFWLKLNPEIFAEVIPSMGTVSLGHTWLRVVCISSTMVREIIKDMEDYEGDKKYDCKTMPVVMGVSFSRLLVIILTFITMSLLGWAQLILYRLDLMMTFWYFAVAVQIPAVYLIIKTITAREQQDFHFLSSLCKLIMVAGILSMQILLISN